MKTCKSHFPLENLCKLFREKQYIGIVYNYITYLSLPISYKIKSLWYKFDSLVNIQLTNKTCEYVNISVWEKWASEKYLIFIASIKPN